MKLNSFVGCFDAMRPRITRVRMGRAAREGKSF